MSEAYNSTPSTNPPQRRSRRLGGSILFPILLIALGVVLLTQTLGLVPWEIWGRLWGFWPVIVILIGLDILVGGRGTIFRYIIGLIAIATIAGILLLTTLSPFPFANFTLPNLITHEVETELSGVANATIRVDTGAAEVRVSELRRESDLLAAGDIQSNGSVEQKLLQEDGVGVLELRSSGEGVFSGFTFATDEWDIMLTQEIPLNLDFSFGVVDAELDLSSLNVTRFTVDAGASVIEIVAPRLGHTLGLISTGAAHIDIEIPEGVAASISVEGGLIGLDIDQSRFPKVGDKFVSPDYESAENRIDLRIDSGASSITIR